MTAVVPLPPHEPFRPVFHFTAERDRINDPNGLVFLDGEYHLFFQLERGGMLHWGHAVSADLVRWERLPIALAPDENGHIYSGTAVVDQADSSGLGDGNGPALVALFTYHSAETAEESQALAWSNDRGRSWHKHPRNPVVSNPGLTDFRDPKVFWHGASRAWVMVVAAGDHVRFYRSPDLLSWEPASVWGAGEGAHDGVWECPDLFELPVGDSGDRRWVLSVSVSAGAPAGGSGMQYFVGAFDGWHFTNANEPETVLWQSWGSDFYAGITFEGLPPEDPRRLMIAWADNWQYRRDVPTQPFSGQLTVVRELTLREFPEGVRLVHTPVRELAALRGRPESRGPTQVSSALEPLADLGDSYEVVVEFDLNGSTGRDFGLEVRVGASEHTRVGYDRQARVAYVDRRHAGLAPHPAFASRHEAPLHPEDERVTFRVLVDRSLVEVFVNDREQLVDLILPSADSRGIRLFCEGGGVHVVHLTAWPLSLP